MDYLPTGRALIDPFNALETAGIRQDMRVADFGVGTVGHFLFPAAKLVGPNGHVYGIDILKPVIEANQSRMKLAGFDNVELVWGNFERPMGSRLPDASMDMVLMVNVLHAVDRLPALQEAKRVLHTGGLLLVIDWNPAGAVLGPAPEKRLSQAQAAALGAQAGFASGGNAFAAGPHHYGFVLKKS